jgi:hypothetical protein
MSWDVLVRSLFTDSGAGAGLAKLNDQIKGVEKAAPGGARGVRAIETGLQSLAFSATGVEGPIGRVAEGMLRFSGGSGLVLGATAGIGLIAGAYKLATAEAQGLAETHERLTKTWQDLVARGRPTVGLMNDYLKAVNDVTTAQEKFDKLNSVGARLGITTLLPSTEGEIAAAQQNLDDARRGALEAKRVVDQASAQLIADAAKRGEKFVTAFLAGIQNLDPGSKIAGLTAAAPQFIAAAGDASKKWTGAFIAGVAELAPDRQLAALLAARPAFAKMGTEAAQAWRDAYLKALQSADWSPMLRATLKGGAFGPMEGVAGPFNPVKRIAAPRGGTFGAGFDVREAGFGQGLGGFDAVDRHTFIAGPVDEKKPGKLDYAAIAASSIALMGALQQGGAGGILSAGGGLLTAAGAGPVGLVATALGGFVSLFDHGQERRHREAMAELTRIRENTEKRGDPSHISVTFMVNGKEISGAIMQDIIYGYGRAVREGYIPALPPS